MTARPRRLPLDQARELWRRHLTAREVTFTEDVDGQPSGVTSGPPLPFVATPEWLGYTRAELDDDDEPEGAA